MKIPPVNPFPSAKLLAALGSRADGYEKQRLASQCDVLMAVFQSKTIPERVKILERGLSFDEEALSEQFNAEVMAMVQRLASERATELAARVGAGALQGEDKSEGSGTAAKADEIAKLQGQASACMDPRERGVIAAKILRLKSSQQNNR